MIKYFWVNEWRFIEWTTENMKTLDKLGIRYEVVPLD